jgi:hypothetical protein
MLSISRCETIELETFYAENDGTPFIPLPDDAEGNGRQITKALDGDGWVLVTWTDTGEHVLARGATVREVLKDPVVIAPYVLND